MPEITMTPGERQLLAKIRSMRKENAQGHSQINDTITRETGKLRKSMKDGFNRMDARFDRLEGND